MRRGTGVGWRCAPFTAKRPGAASDPRNTIRGDDPAQFFGAAWAGTVRTVQCPHCRRRQTVARRPMPFEVTCRDCRRPFRVTERGAVAVRAG